MAIEAEVEKRLLRYLQSKTSETTVVDAKRFVGDTMVELGDMKEYNAIFLLPYDDFVEKIYSYYGWETQVAPVQVSA